LPDGMVRRSFTIVATYANETTECR
jgi:hypothetical protein